MLALLAIQVGIQPVLIKWYARDTSSVVVRLLVTEILKVVIACSSLLYKEELYPELKQWTFSMAWATTGQSQTIFKMNLYLLKIILNSHSKFDLCVAKLFESRSCYCFRWRDV